MAGITQKGGGDFAMVEAGAVQTREDGTRLDAELAAILASLAKMVPIFIGTTAEYNAAEDKGEIPIGSIVIITDDEEAGSSTSAVLGTAVLGQMILG
jgi:hypothetical protein